MFHCLGVISIMESDSDDFEMESPQHNKRPCSVGEKWKNLHIALESNCAGNQRTFLEIAETESEKNLIARRGGLIYNPAMLICEGHYEMLKTSNFEHNFIKGKKLCLYPDHTKKLGVVNRFAKEGRSIKGRIHVIGDLRSQQLLLRLYFQPHDSLICHSCVTNKLPKKLKEDPIEQPQVLEQDLEPEAMDIEDLAIPGPSSNQENPYAAIQDEVQQEMLNQKVKPPPSYSEATRITRSMTNPQTPIRRTIGIGVNPIDDQDDTPKSSASVLTCGSQNSDSSWIPSQEQKRLLREAVNNFLKEADEQQRVEWSLDKSFKDYSEEEKQTKTRRLREFARILGAIIMAGLKSISTDSENQLEIYEEVTSTIFVDKN